MKMRCFYLCLILCLNLREELCPGMFLAGKHLALKRLAQTADARSKTGKKMEKEFKNQSCMLGTRRF